MSLHTERMLASIKEGFLKESFTFGEATDELASSSALVSIEVDALRS